MNATYRLQAIAEVLKQEERAKSLLLGVESDPRSITLDECREAVQSMSYDGSESETRRLHALVCA